MPYMPTPPPIDPKYKRKQMCYDKSNNRLFKDSDTNTFLSRLHFDMVGAKDKLLQLRELPEYGQIFTDGERCSIDHMIKQMEARLQGVKELQRHFV